MKLLSIQLPCGLKELAAISDTLGKMHGPSLIARSSDDGKSIDFLLDAKEKPVSPSPQGDTPTLWLSLPDPIGEQDVALLAALADGDAWTADTQQALRFAQMGYTVKRKDQHTDGHFVETILPADALATSLEFDKEMRGARELNRPGCAEATDQLPNLIMAGDIYCGCDPDEAAGDPLPYTIVIQCQSAAQARAAINTGMIRYTVFDSDKS